MDGISNRLGRIEPPEEAQTTNEMLRLTWKKYPELINVITAKASEIAESAETPRTLETINHRLSQVNTDYGLPNTLLKKWKQYDENKAKEAREVAVSASKKLDKYEFDNALPKIVFSIPPDLSTLTSDKIIRDKNLFTGQQVVYTKGTGGPNVTPEEISQILSNS